MKIAITVNTSWNIYNFRSGLIRAIIAQGHQVIAIAPEDEFSQRLVDMGCTFRSIKMDNTGSNPITDLKLYLQLKKIYKREKPDIIYQYTVKPNIYGSLAARSLDIPVINNVSGLGTVFLNKGMAPFIAKKLYKWAFQQVALVFFQNNDDKRDFLNQIKLPKLNTQLIPGSGINLSTFQSQKELSNRPVRFLMIARLILDKGVMEYLEAARILKQSHPMVEFQLLGQLDEGHARGVKLDTLSSYIEEKSICYLGTNDQVRDIIEDATCVVLPSYREGTPKTLLEAAAMGRPIITTDVPGCREVVVDGENGLLCQVRSSQDLREKMHQIIKKDLFSLKVMGEKGRKLVEDKFDEKIIIEKYLSETSKIID
ncbi:glycosyltransferase family 4 protein [Reichenbachiella agarivorans]|uniref:Glycosyltransferase family 4 protein n=1 Tax=Reichenbachiella agarivorans TaxID=2979464 RepID=A0ABY6CSZ1_9BACT|nr:glycosyltransferase family 4 protein [Reichenbachiella agarivorans]UXP33639.1 glycosyltransferase family 4 protein [Reichenbachiella agarivorans]